MDEDMKMVGGCGFLFLISSRYSLGLARSLCLAFEGNLVLLGIEPANISRRLGRVGFGIPLLASKAIFGILLITVSDTALRLLLCLFIVPSIKLNIEIFSRKVFCSLSLYELTFG
jgi:ABC-type Fe3+-siderophore transport system permease subunit